MELAKTISFLAKENGINEVNFLEDVHLQDDSDGSGAFIKEWNLPFPEPTKEELIAAEPLMLDHEASIAYLELRINAYPPYGDQLGMMYDDKVNGTNTWVEAIAAIKAKYPKQQ